MCEIRTPFLVYTVNVTVQQLDFKSKGEDGQEGEDVWRTVGYVEIGPRRIGDNTARKHKGKSSGPQVNLFVLPVVFLAPSGAGKYARLVHTNINSM